MKQTLLVTIGILAIQVSQAMPVLIPTRCAHDNLAQWTEGQPLAGTARGRNEWLKVCKPMAYDLIYPAGVELDPSLPTRLAYPTYGIVTGAAANGDPVFTTDGYVAPTVPPANEGAAECQVPQPNRIVGVCTAGCVVPDSVVDTGYADLAIEDMKLSHVPTVNVPYGTIDRGLGSEVLAVRSYISDLIPTKQKVFVVKTISGGELHLSEAHPMLTGTGKMVRAKDLKPGSSLITASGNKDLITDVSERSYNGKFYNLTVDTNDKQKSIYIVQGYISGDKKIQDEQVTRFNRLMFRNLAFGQ